MSELTSIYLPKAPRRQRKEARYHRSEAEIEDHLARLKSQLRHYEEGPTPFGSTWQRYVIEFDEGISRSVPGSEILRPAIQAVSDTTHDAKEQMVQVVSLAASSAVTGVLFGAAAFLHICNLGYPPLLAVGLGFASMGIVAANCLNLLRGRKLES